MIELKIVIKADEAGNVQIDTVPTVSPDASVAELSIANQMKDGIAAVLNAVEESLTKPIDEPRVEVKKFHKSY